jgi:hypothetical protein
LFVCEEYYDTSLREISSTEGFDRTCEIEYDGISILAVRLSKTKGISMFSKTSVLTTLMAVGLCTSVFAGTSGITINGTEIIFPDASTQSTASTGGGGGGSNPFYRVIDVSAGNIPTTNGDNLIAAMASITDADWGGHYVIQLDGGE